MVMNMQEPSDSDWECPTCKEPMDECRICGYMIYVCECDEEHNCEEEEE